MTGNPYGLTIRDRQPPNLPDRIRDELVRVVTDAAADRPVTGRDNEDLAAETLTAIRDALAVHVTSGPTLNGWADDLTELASTAAVSRAAVTCSPVWQVPGLARDVVLDALHAWFVVGDWPQRARTAAELVLWLHEQGVFAPDRNTTDRRLLDKALQEQQKGTQIPA